MEVLDIAYVHGWPTVTKYLERTSTSGNKELRLAIENVKREEALGLKRSGRRGRSVGSPPSKRSMVASSSSSSSSAAPAGPSSSVGVLPPGAWLPPPMPNQHYNAFPAPQPYPGYGMHRSQTPRERMGGNCFRCGEQGHLIKACPRKLAPM